MKKKIVLLDFDTSVATFDGDRPVAVREGALEAIHELRAHNFQVHLFSQKVSETVSVENFLKENKVEFDKVCSLPEFDILVSSNSTSPSSNWKWTLESIVFHSPKPEEKKDVQKEMHNAMNAYIKHAKNANKGCLCDTL